MAADSDTARESSVDRDDVLYATAMAAADIDKLFRRQLLGRDNAAELSGDETIGASDGSCDAATVKQAALKLGADLVGICRMNPSWLRAGDAHGQAAPDGCEFVVVMAVAMDRELIAGSPGPTAAVATRVGYMKMDICAAAVAAFLRRMGHRAIASGNDTAMSVPLALAAGLGRLGRNGMVVTPEYGPCVRICKVFTDCPLEADTPADPLILPRCLKCKLCAKACPAGAIDNADEPVAACGDADGGRWSYDGDKCMAFWNAHDRGCSTCIAACPLTTTSSGVSA